MTLPINWDRPMTNLAWHEQFRLIKQVRDMDDPRAMLVAINGWRHSVNTRGTLDAPKVPLPYLMWSDELANAAKFHAIQMVEQGFFGHESPSGDGPADRALVAGYPHEVVELIERGQATAVRACQRWWKIATRTRQGRRSEFACVCSPDFKVVGAAQYDWYWVAMFGAEA
jgi:uncharacterized protein YkwD